MNTPSRHTGIVISFGRGYGFIKRDDGLGDCFAHFSGIADQDPRGLRSLVKGARVEFDIVAVPGKRPAAVNIRTL
jgi:cold shock CspA family protein